MPPDASGDDPYVRVTLELRQSTLVWLDALREEWGLRSRGALVSRLLDELAQPHSDGEDPTDRRRDAAEHQTTPVR